MKLDLKPVGKIVHNFASCLWITWPIGDSAAGGGGEGERRRVLYRGTLSSDWHYDYIVIEMAFGRHLYSLPKPRNETT